MQSIKEKPQIQMTKEVEKAEVIIDEIFLDLVRLFSHVLTVWYVAESVVRVPWNSMSSTQSVDKT